MNSNINIEESLTSGKSILIYNKKKEMTYSSSSSNSKSPETKSKKLGENINRGIRPNNNENQGNLGNEINCLFNQPLLISAPIEPEGKSNEENDSSTISFSKDVSIHVSFAKIREKISQIKFII
jgi:hypothetical protein